MWACLLTCCGLPAALHAQQLLPLPADPARARAVAPGMAARGTATTTALALPFFEDFAGQPEGKPNRTRWKDGNVLVNERFSQAPPSRGMATFDGLDSLGRSYGLPSFYGLTDVLTSQAIDLSAGRPGDRTYLSFYWQTGSIVGGPNDERGSRQVRLVLEFLDNTGTWRQVWYNPSLLFGQGTNLKTLTRFRQRFIAVNDARYFHAGFRFRFRSYGNLNGTRDTWNLDYLLLDRNRDTASVSYADLVLSAPLSSLLKRYAAMPAWQYNAAANPAQELNDSAFTTLNNLDTLVVGTPYSYQGTVRVLPAGPETQFLTGSAFSAAGAKQTRLGGSVRGVPLAVGSGTRVQHSVHLSLLSGAGSPNDTVRRVTEFGNYYAYDDGSAEGTAILAQGSSLPTSRAIRFELNRPDQVLKIRYYYAGASGSGSIPAATAVTFGVWDAAANGQPNATPKATVTESLPTSVAAGGFREVTFSQPVAVSGTFFIGYTQPANTTLFIQFGADLNSRLPRLTLFDRENNAWTDRAATFAPMLRPVMSSLVSSAHSAAADAAVTIYPNPSTGLVQVQGRYTRAVALDALGRPVWEQPAAQAGQGQLDLRRLPAGVYVLRLTLPDGAVGTQRVVLQP
ncbi:hypothetical protein DLM85_15945 [Hymenobacter edaphi]|uniref:Secretion system C-terminal sorting domain-containing protein n=1 Tax=Hymenobacter edaphi TaxID=2211146 RepID=A0A328BI84_9BACT|nr:hypothetical protein DLM85_15945 [Hymenobacter edaphi]